MGSLPRNHVVGATGDLARDYLIPRDEPLRRFHDRAIEMACKSKPATQMGAGMKLMLSLIICLALSACATDYASQLSEANYGRRVFYSKDSLDPTQVMNGLYASGPSGAFCLASCSRQPQLWSSGWAP